MYVQHCMLPIAALFLLHINDYITILDIHCIYRHTYMQTYKHIMIKAIHILIIVCLSSCSLIIYIIQYHQELIIVVRESIQHAIGMCKMSA